MGAKTAKVTLRNNYSGTKSVSYTVAPKGTAISKLTPAAKTITVAWKKQATQVTGYQVQYATTKSFSGAKTATIEGAAKTSKKLGGLASGKTYYVRVRTYKKVGGKVYHSAWSAAKSAKTK